VLPTTATHYLTNCTRARGFPGSLRKNLSIFSGPERSMRFTTPSIASAGESVFAFENYSFPKPDVPSPLLFRHPPLRFDSIFSNGYRSCSVFYFRAPREPGPFGCGCSAERRVEIDLLKAPVKETQARQSETRFPRCDARAFRAFFESSALPLITRKNVCRFTRRSFQMQNPFGVP